MDTTGRGGEFPPSRQARLSRAVWRKLVAYGRAMTICDGLRWPSEIALAAVYPACLMILQSARFRHFYHHQPCQGFDYTRLHHLMIMAGSDKVFEVAKAVIFD